VKVSVTKFDNFYIQSLFISFVAQAQVSCTLDFVIPGFMKAGSTFLFGTIAKHPQVLNTLRGVTFKETGCYGAEYTFGKVHRYNDTRLAGGSGVVRSSVRNRMQCFPFVEPGEQVYFGDGTVWYNSHKEVLQPLVDDNPGLKAVFAVRDPVQRLESHHRFNYRTLCAGSYPGDGDLNEIVHFLLDSSKRPLNVLLWFRKQAVDALEETDPVRKKKKLKMFVKNYYKGQKKNAAYPLYLQQFIKVSLYFPHIYNWFEVMPPDTVTVVPVDSLAAKRVSTEVKLEYVRNLSSPATWKALSQDHTTSSTSSSSISSNGGSSGAREAETREEIRKSVALDNEYTLQQFNRIYR
jgi:hypothetical protein